MRHESLLRSDDGKIIISRKTNRAKSYVQQCLLKHAACPHLVEKDACLKAVLKIVKVVLKRLNEKGLLKTLNTIEDIRAVPLHMLDDDYRLAKTGNQYLLPLISEIPTSEEGAISVQELDVQWHKIIGKIDPLRQIVIHGLERILAVAEIEISSQ